MLSVKDSRLPGDHTPLDDKLPDSSIIFHARHPHSPATQEIPGNPDLTTHGEMTLLDGGLSFDGQESHALAQIAPDDCVINPEKCADGMSFGTKLKLDKIGENAGPRWPILKGVLSAAPSGLKMVKRLSNGCCDIFARDSFPPNA